MVASLCDGFLYVLRYGTHGGADYAADEGERLFYAGDFTSRRAPGFEAAALSGLDAASALKRVLGV